MIHFRNLSNPFRGKNLLESPSKDKRANSKPTEKIANETLDSSEMEKLKFNHLYYVSKDETKKFNLFAIAPTLERNGRLEWRDTARGGSIVADKILLDNIPLEEITTSSPDPKEIQIITPDGENIVLKFLTNEQYEAKLRKFCEGQPKFKDTDDIQSFYLKTF